MADSPGLFSFDDNYWDIVKQVSGVDFTTTSASQVDITGLAFNPVGSSLYEVESVLKCRSSGSNGMNFALAYSTSGATGNVLILGATSVGGFTGNSTILGTAGGTNYNSGAATDFIIVIRAMVSIGVNIGSVTVRVNVNASGTTTISIGSVIKARRLK